MGRQIHEMKVYSDINYATISQTTLTLHTVSPVCSGNYLVGESYLSQIIR